MENEVNEQCIHQGGSNSKYNVIDLSEPKDNPFLPKDYEGEFIPSFLFTERQFALLRIQERMDAPINQSFLNEGYLINKIFHRPDEK